jgi:hypothetical protein
MKSLIIVGLAVVLILMASTFHDPLHRTIALAAGVAITVMLLRRMANYTGSRIDRQKARSDKSH